MDDGMWAEDIQAADVKKRQPETGPPLLWCGQQDSIQSLFRSVQPSRATVRRTVAFESFESVFHTKQKTPLPGCFLFGAGVHNGLDLN